MPDSTRPMTIRTTRRTPAIPRRRNGATRSDWITASLIAVILGSLVWRAVEFERGRKQQVVAQSCVMPDGSILVIEHVDYGQQHRLETGSQTAFGSTGRTHMAFTAENSIGIWLSRRDADTGAALDFDWWSHSVAVDAHGCRVHDSAPIRVAASQSLGSLQSGSRPFQKLSSESIDRYDQIFAHSAFTPLRTTDGKFKLLVFNVDGKQVASFDVPDPRPFVIASPTWQPAATPAARRAGDLEVTLRRVTATTRKARADSAVPLDVVDVQAALAATRAGQPATGWTRFRTKLSNEMGVESELYASRLCPGDAAWKLSVRVFRDANATFDASESWTVPEVAIPPANTTRMVNAVCALQGANVEVLALGGSGKTQHVNLTPGFRGSWGASGSVGSGTAHAFRIDTDSQQPLTTVECALPHLVIRVHGLTVDHWGPDLRISDERGRAVVAHGPQHHADQTQYWFLEIPPDAKSLTIRAFVHLARYAEFLVKPPVPEPTEAFAAADALAQRGKWHEAAAEFQRLLAVSEGSHWHWYRSICLQAYLGNGDEYRRQCSKMLELFADDADAHVAERTAKACLFWGESALSDARLIVMATRPLRDQPDFAWFLLVKGIADLRAGKFDAADETLRRIETSRGHDAYNGSLGHLFRAVSLAASGNAPAAREALNRAGQIMDNSLPKPDAADFGSAWNDWLVCQIVRREAEATIRGTTATKREPAESRRP